MWLKHEDERRKSLMVFTLL